MNQQVRTSSRSCSSTCVWLVQHFAIDFQVLSNDPGMGVIRHADAGYERAIEVADERGVRIPMREE